MAVPYSVPMKGGANFETIALSPYVDTLDLAERGRIRAGYNRAMRSLSLEVQIKRQNTLRFFEHIDAAPTH